MRAAFEMLRFLSIFVVVSAAVWLAACSSDVLDHYNLGIDALERGDTASALTHLETAARERPSDPDIRINYGIALLGAGQA